MNLGLGMLLCVLELLDSILKLVVLTAKDSAKFILELCVQHLNLLLQSLVFLSNQYFLNIFDIFWVLLAGRSWWLMATFEACNTSLISSRAFPNMTCLCTSWISSHRASLFSPLSELLWHWRISPKLFWLLLSLLQQQSSCRLKLFSRFISSVFQCTIPPMTLHVGVDPAGVEFPSRRCLAVALAFSPSSAFSSVPCLCTSSTLRSAEASSRGH